jgi:hypothetical protein
MRVAQHYPPETQENYDNFLPRDVVMGNGKELEFPEGSGGLESASRILMKDSHDLGVPPAPRVALCISGQPRSALKTFSFIMKNIIEPNNADVFIHMHYDSVFYYMEKSHADKGNCILEKGLDHQIIDLYKPKKYLIENPRNFQKPNINIPEKRLEITKQMNSHKEWTDEQHIQYIIKQLTSMYYSIYKSNELKEIYANENGFVYDYVIRIRFDLLPSEPIYCSQLDPNFIHYLEIGQPDQLISDWLNIGSNTIMNVYASLYLNMEYLNTFKYYKKEDRQPNLLEPSDSCGGLYEHMLRDLMHLYNIPKNGIHINCQLLG